MRLSIDMAEADSRAKMSSDAAEQADQFLDRVPRLPPTPTIATELLGLFKQSDPDIDRIVQLIEYDPALTAEVLKRCNSAYFSRGTVISDMFQAVTRVGFYEIYCVVLSTVGSRAMSLAQAVCGLDAAALWQHSVRTAVAAGTLAAHVHEDEAVAFTSGLLHDIGKLVFASVEPAKYGEGIRAAGCCGPGLIACEEAIFGMNHADIGARLLVRWGFPPDIALAILHHHGPPSVANSDEQFAAIINLANGIGHLNLEEPEPGPEFAASHGEAMIILQITPRDLPALALKTGKGLQRVQDLLQLAV